MIIWQNIFLFQIFCQNFFEFEKKMEKSSKKNYFSTQSYKILWKDISNF